MGRRIAEYRTATARQKQAQAGAGLLRAITAGAGGVTLASLGVSSRQWTVAGVGVALSLACVYFLWSYHQLTLAAQAAEEALEVERDKDRQKVRAVSKGKRAVMDRPEPRAPARRW